VPLTGGARGRFTLRNPRVSPTSQTLHCMGTRNLRLRASMSERRNRVAQWGMSIHSSRKLVCFKAAREASTRAIVRSIPEFISRTGSRVTRTRRTVPCMRTRVRCRGARVACTGAFMTCMRATMNATRARVRAIRSRVRVADRVVREHRARVHAADAAVRATRVRIRWKGAAQRVTRARIHAAARGDRRQGPSKSPASPPLYAHRRKKIKNRRPVVAKTRR
jgi:hypothetical protein